MATIFEDNFNSYNNGDLNGQGNWAGAVQFDVQGDVVREGAKAIKCSATSGQNLLISKIGDLTPDGRITFYVRVSNTTYNYYLIMVRNSNDTAYAVSLKWQGTTLYAYTPDETPIKTGMEADKWYQIEMEWRHVDMKARYSIDGGDWTDWLAREVNNDPGSVRMVNYANGGSIDVYFDYIAENPIVPPAVGRSHAYIF